MVSVLEMTNFFGARGSFWSLRPQNTIKLATQSALGEICMGKWPVPSLAELFLRLQKGPRRSDFSEAPFTTNAIPEKMSTNGRGSEGRKNSKTRI